MSTLLDTRDLLWRWDALITDSKKIKLAVAWATVCPALDILVKNVQARGIELQAVVGVTGNTTDPSVLETLSQVGQLRVADKPGATYHPKYFLFHLLDGSTVCWVGSANLTIPAFSTNNELVHEFIDTGDAAGWFRQHWRKAPKDTRQEIEKYRRRWVVPDRGGSPGRPMKPPILKGAPWTLIDPPPPTWAAYVDALRKVDAWWAPSSAAEFDVLSETHSWCNTLLVGHQVTKMDWSHLEEYERVALMGATRKNNYGFALLGNYSQAHIAVGIFKHDWPQNIVIRQSIRGVLDGLNDVKDADMPKAMGTAMRDICSMQGFSRGVASRLITLARPDWGISLNQRSVKAICSLSGLPPGTLRRSDGSGYRALMEWLSAQPWHGATRPRDPFEAQLWTLRAGLLDAFTYDGRGVASG